METKQFQGEVTDFGEVGLWKDFGGGSDVETADEPEEDGEDAFSTGGAYTHIPTGIKVVLLHIFRKVNDFHNFIKKIAKIYKFFFKFRIK